MFKVKNITKKYSGSDDVYRGYKDVSFDLKKGEIVCILGESGSGKSALLKSLVELEKPDSGSITVDKDVTTAYVSQEYTLWPHLTVLENMTLVPGLKSGNKDSFNDEAIELLERFDLSSHATNYPHELSGGQKQRVALLRAIMTKPDILFLDEVTSALDPELTKGVLDMVRVLAKDGYTMVLVTHHLSFAMSVAHRIFFLDQGEMLADQDSVSFFSQQTNPKIKSFITEIARKDENISVYKGREQFQAYHLNLMRHLPEGSTIHVAGAVADSWYAPMGDLYETYEKVRHERNISWNMVMYAHGQNEQRLIKEQPNLNTFRLMSRSIQNPANYNVFGDTVITQIFEDEPTIIEIKNQNIADAYMRFFEELWEASEEFK
jgi:ABC-type polar amino acid transport system ATPase subunit